MTSPSALFATAAIALALAPTAASAGDLRVRLTGVEQEVGSVRVALYASAADYDTGKPLARRIAAPRTSGVEIVFPNLPPGRYGLSSFHDVNGNEDLDRNFVGMPTEPYGFSRNARGRFGPPSFEDLAFEMDADAVTMEVELR